MMELITLFLGGYMFNLGGQGLLIHSIPVLSVRERDVLYQIIIVLLYSNKVAYLCVVGILFSAVSLLQLRQIVWICIVLRFIAIHLPYRYSEWRTYLSDMLFFLNFWMQHFFVFNFTSL